MNPHASTKCARRVSLALAATAGVFLIASCGSGGPPRPNNGGFGAGSLSGTYVFSSAGADANGNLLDLTGAFTANGSGGITGGTMDVIDSGFTPPSPVAQPITSGSYNVDSDGRGAVTLTNSVGTFVLGFVLISSPGGPSAASTHGLVSEFDANGSGSGTLDLQTAVTSLSQIAGPFAFNLSGIAFTGSTFGATGAITLNSSGTITAGVEDFNAGGSIFLDETVTGAATLGTGTGPGSITLNTLSFALTFDFYPIDATHLKLIETDFTEILAGDAFTQTGASIPSGAMVFTMAGGTASTGPIGVGGLMSSDGTGNFTSGLEDVNDDGSLSPAQLQFTGTAAGPAGVGGRVVVNLSGFSPAIQCVVYPSSGGLLVLETDSVTVMQGAAYAQTATSFQVGNSVGYGLNLTGINLQGLFEIDDIAQFNATSGNSNNMNGVLQENDEGTLLRPTNLTGTYTPDSPATGRGSILVPSLGTALGGISLEYYVIDGSTVLTIEGDTAQVGAGVFEMQSSNGVAPAMRARVSLVHPAFRPHGAFRHR